MTPATAQARPRPEPIAIAALLADIRDAEGWRAKHRVLRLSEDELLAIVAFADAAAPVLSAVSELVQRSDAGEPPAAITAALTRACNAARDFYGRYLA